MGRRRESIGFLDVLGAVFYLIALITALEVLGVVPSQAEMIPLRGISGSPLLPSVLILGVPHVFLVVAALKKGVKAIRYLFVVGLLIILMIPISMVFAISPNKLYVADDLGNKYPPGTYQISNKARELIVYYNMTKDQNIKYIIRVNGTENSGYSFPAAPVQVDLLHLKLNYTYTYVTFSTTIKVLNQYGMTCEEYEISGHVRLEDGHYVLSYKASINFYESLEVTINRMISDLIDYLAGILVILITGLLSAWLLSRRTRKFPPYHW